MQVQFLGQEDPLEEEMATCSSILAWRIPWTEELADYNPWGCKELDMTEGLGKGKMTKSHMTFQSLFFFNTLIYVRVKESNIPVYSQKLLKT